MAQIPPIDDAYINEIIKSNGPYNPALLKTQGVKMRELIKLLRDRMEQGDIGVVHTTGDESISGTKTFTLIKAEGLSVNNLANPSLNTVISPLTGVQTKLLNLSEGTFGVQLSASVLAASRSQLLQDRDGVIALTEDLSDFPTLSQFNTELNKKINNEERGVPGGVSTLDGGGKIPASQLPDSISGALTYQGTWNAATNAPALADPPASSTKGYYYVTNTAGTQFGITFAVGDWIVSNGTVWEKVDNTDAVTTVFGRLGNVIANEEDYSTFYPLLTDKQNSLITDGTGVKYPTVDAVTAALATGQTIGANTTGNAAKATKLATPRTINGVAFDGTTNIIIPGGPLEAIDEGNGVGIVRTGRIAGDYGPVGEGAVDLSYNIGASSARGATGIRSVAFGTYTRSNGVDSTSFGYQSEASGIVSTAFGGGNATGPYSTAFGENTYAMGSHSTVFGELSRAPSFASVTIGRFNRLLSSTETSWTPGSPIFVVGNGIDDDNRSEAYILYNNGKSTQYGIASYNQDYSSAFTDNDLVTKKYVDDNAGGGSTLTLSEVLATESFEALVDGYSITSEVEVDESTIVEQYAGTYTIVTKNPFTSVASARAELTLYDFIRLRLGDQETEGPQTYRQLQLHENGASLSYADDDVTSSSIGVNEDGIYLETTNTVDAYTELNVNSSTGIIFKHNSVNVVTISTSGDVTANSFIKEGGLATEYLMADGSVSTSGGGDVDFDSTPTEGSINAVTSQGIKTYVDERPNYLKFMQGGAAIVPISPNQQDIYFVNGPPGSVTVNLDPAAGFRRSDSGQVITIIKDQFGTSPMSIVPNGTEIIVDGAANATPYVLTNKGDRVTIVSDGTKWIVLSKATYP